MNSPDDIIQRYRLLRRSDGSLWEIARDASGTAYKAIDTDLELPVAITIVDLAKIDTELARAEFTRRARSLLVLQDARIAPITQFGVDTERTYVTRRYVDGESLAQNVKRERAIEWTESLRIAMEIAGALETMVGLGVVHGNLSPKTVIFKSRTRDYVRREISLVDFALVDVEKLSVRSDIRALGEVLRTMLLGSMPPHESAMYSQQPQSGIEYEYPDAVPSPVVDLVKQMTSIDDTFGPSNPTELIRWITEFLEGPPNHVIPHSPRDIDFASPHETRSDDPGETATPIADNLQFTAYRPKGIRPNVWAKMFVFAHLDERPSWLNEDDRSPHEEVIAQAQQLLGKKFDEYRHSTDDSRLAVPREGEITMLPEVSGIEFNPPRRSFFWKDGVAVHTESFDMRANPSLDGQTARGRLTIFLGRIILAEISLAIRVDQQYIAQPNSAATTDDRHGQERSASRAFRKVFASYSHRDLGIVEEMERHARSFGDEYLRDWVHLRSGERWHDGLQQLIRAADVFQLFWSPNSAQSEFVAQEWQYALALGRDTFVRPTYWQDPMPDPPEQLRSLHFHRLAVAVGSTPSAAPPTMSSAPQWAASAPTAPMASAPMPIPPPSESRPKRFVSLFVLLVYALVVAAIVTATLRSCS